MSFNRVLFIGPAISLLIIAFGLLIIEASLRWHYAGRSKLVYPVGKITIDRSLYEIGIDGIGLFRTGRFGLRGENLFPWHQFRVLVLGSSGALGWMLDEQENWTTLLQSKISNEHQRAWIGNAARLGNRMAENFVQLQSIIGAKKIKPNLILIFASGVDLQVSLFQREHFRPNFLQSEMDRLEIESRAFSIFPKKFELSQSAFLYWIKNRKVDFDGKVKPHAGFFKNARLMRKNAKKIYSQENLPSQNLLYKEVEYYQKRIFKLAKNSNILSVFVTRPTFWHDQMNKEEEMLWVGYSGKGKDKKFPDTSQQTEFYSSGAMAKAFDDYNKQIMLTCEKYKMQCFDLAGRIPKTKENFFDGSHLTPKGSQMVANEIYKYLVKNKLLH